MVRATIFLNTIFPNFNDVESYVIYFWYFPGNDTNSFALQIFENSNLWCENSHNRLQVKQKTKDIKGSNIAVLLDLERQTMNVYWNGRLQTDDNHPGRHSFVGIVGPVTPAFSVLGSIVQFSLHTGLEKPTKSTGEGIDFPLHKDFLSNCNKLSFENKKVYVKGLVCKETLVPRQRRGGT